MYHFSTSSQVKLNECHPELQRLFLEVVKKIDCTVLTGHRSAEDQAMALKMGLSKLGPGKSRHNSSPSEAIDIAPYPVDWKDLKRFYYFAGIVLGVAQGLGIDITWGGDWDRDQDLNDQNFMDLVHFELTRK